MKITDKLCLAADNFRQRTRDFYTENTVNHVIENLTTIRNLSTQGNSTVNGGG